MSTMFFNPEVMAIYSSWGTDGNLVRDLCIGIPLLILGIITSFLFVKYEGKKQIKWLIYNFSIKKTDSVLLHYPFFYYLHQKFLYVLVFIW